MEQSLTQDGEQTTQVEPDGKNPKPDVPLSPKKIKRGTKCITSKTWDHFTIIEGTYEVLKKHNVIIVKLESDVILKVMEQILC
ncbi:hypothetical protein GIB67_012181 [Kingdonia uniflora]|uniref:Uncharacterized protein n=1 Tax=Kingdonia uniflora TaxID=39325 RepID=A0A7J7NNU9_9MAGN|nr:hypothetical protein GIB67_012181 [Kingdonia uniflora]